MRTFTSVLIILLAICTSAQAEVVTIGLASNFSEVAPGTSNPYGNYFRNGIQLALAEFAPQLLAKKISIELQEFDYGNSPTRVPKAVREAIESKSIAVIGYNYSSHALVAAPLHQAAKLPMITPSATADRVGRFGAFVHPLCFNNTYMGETLAGLAKNKLHAKQAIVIPAVDCAYCQDLARAFATEFERNGGRVVLTTPVLESDTEFTKVVNAVKAQTTDLIFIPNQELNSGRIASALLKAGVNKPYLGADGWGSSGSELFSVIKDNAFQGYSASHWHPNLTDAVSKKFSSDYEKRFLKEPNDTAVLAYDSMSFLLTAILKSPNRSRVGLEETIAQMRTFKGVTGDFLFQKNNSPKKTIVILKAANKKYSVDGIFGPAAGQKAAL